ncbi:hypothetical protein ABW20_dc0110027 [Dactylellina cionopaga]|nr:hypothetical protein ABW20_dc0110027 [Dactylellina cionopaga]
MDVYERVDDEAEEKRPLGIFDPSCEEEQNVLLATLASFYLYRRAAHYTFTHRRRRNFYSLPLAQQEVLKKVSYQPTLDNLDDCIERNSNFAEFILKSGCDSFGIDIRGAETWKDLADNGDMDKARSTMKQFLHQLFGAVTPRCDVRVLVPGAGLGRLAFEICRRGYAAEGNEFSYHQLIASNFVLNNTRMVNEFVIHPFCLGFSNHRSRAEQARAITIPDVHPATELNKQLEFTVPEGSHRPPGVYRYRPSQYFSMSAGEFVESYNTPEAKGTFDCVVTCFFIDTARNLLAYLETIRNVLVEGGVWINNGPLLWHWEGADATQIKNGAEGRKEQVKSFDEVESGMEDAEAPQLPLGSTLNTTPRSRAHTHPHDSDTPSHSHIDLSDLHTHSHNTGSKFSSSPTQQASSGQNDWRGSLEFTLDEVFDLAKLYGFEIVEKGRCKTGYIDDQNSMGKYVYEPEYWMAAKTGTVDEAVLASFKKFAQQEDDEGENENEDEEGEEGSGLDSGGVQL